MSPQSRETKAKINKWDYIKLKSFCIARKLWTKRKPTEWEKIFASDISNKGLISEYTKNSYNSTSKKQTTQLKNGLEDLNRHYSKENRQMANRHVNSCSTSLSSGKCKSKPQWDITTHLSEWLSSKTTQITNVGEDVEKREPSCTVGGNVNSTAATMKKSMEVPQKIKNRTTIQSSNSTSGYFSKKNKNTNSKRHVHPHIHYSIIHNSQDMKQP